MVRCPNCNTAILQKSKDGKMRLRGRTVIFDGTKATAICSGCRKEVEVPLILKAHTNNIKHIIIE